MSFVNEKLSDFLIKLLDFMRKFKMISYLILITRISI